VLSMRISIAQGTPKVDAPMQALISTRLSNLLVVRVR